MCILTGLGPEYETIRVNYTSRPPLPSLQEVKTYLSHYEATLEQNTTLNAFNSANLASAFNNQLQLGSHTSSPLSNIDHSASNGRSFLHTSGNVDSGFGKFGERGRYDDSRNRGFYGRGRGRGRSGRSWKPQCQICGIYGHLANVCYYRDSNSGHSVFQGFSGPPTAQANFPSAFQHTGVNANFSQFYNPSSVFGGVSTPFSGMLQPGVYGSTVPQFGASFNNSCPSGGGMFPVAAGYSSLAASPLLNSSGCHTPSGPMFSPTHTSAANRSSLNGSASVNMAMTPVLMDDPNWYLDSGATNHVVSDGDNLLQKLEYNGSNKLLVGNGQSLDIASIGQTDGSGSSQRST
nr:uncharacterized protein LOC125419622 isoform X1 [Ziziphus jujuba var. spinosa]